MRGDHKGRPGPRALAGALGSPLWRLATFRPRRRAHAGVNRQLFLLLVAVATLGTRHGGAAEAEDYLSHRWYRIDLVIFEQSPVVAAREGFGTDGVAARHRLLENVRYPNEAFTLAEDPTTVDGEIAFGPPPPVDTNLPVIVANLLPPAWFAGPCATEHWDPPVLRWTHPFETPQPAPPDPCLPDPWDLELAGIEQGMHQIVPGSTGPAWPDEPAAPEDQTAEKDPRQAVLDALTVAFADYEAELLRTSYVWQRTTPLFATERSILAKHYEIVASGSWHQPVPPREEPQPLLVQVGTMDENRRFPLEGWLSVTLGRYIHLRVLLEYRLPDDRVALLSEQRRMRSEETHYLDHPAIGILARVDPLVVPEDLGLLLDELEEIDE